MLNNFKSMPILLKFLTGHGLFCLFLFFVSVIPRDHYFELGGRKVTYAEWWMSGAGPLLASLGLAMAVAGLLFLNRRGLGRFIYLACFGGALIGPFAVAGELLPAALAVGIVVALGNYLFMNQRVREYFASNNSFKPKPLRGSA